MLIEKFVDVLIMFAIKTGSNKLKDKLEDKLHKKRVKTYIQGFIERQRNNNFDYLPHANEIDFEGLQKYLDNEVHDDIKIYLFDDDQDKRDKSKDSILSAAYCRANATDDFQREMIENLIHDVLNMEKNYHKRKIDEKYKLLSNIAAENILDPLSEKMDKLLEKVDDIPKKTNELCKKELAGDLPTSETSPQTPSCPAGSMPPAIKECSYQNETEEELHKSIKQGQKPVPIDGPDRIDKIAAEDDNMKATNVRDNKKNTKRPKQKQIRLAALRRGVITFIIVLASIATITGINLADIRFLPGDSPPAEIQTPDTSDNDTEHPPSPEQTREIPEAGEESTEVSVDAQANDESDLTRLISGANDVISIELTEDINLSVTLTIPASKSVVLTSAADNIFSLTAVGSFDAIEVENGAALTIDNIQILRSPNTHGRGIHNKGTLILENGIIDGHVNIYEGALGWGGGILNNFGANFIMRGGTISNNRTASAGGGVFNHPHAVFTMECGYIRRNSTAYGGGGVYNVGQFNMQGGVISENNASGDGGGVFNGATGEFNASNGEIYRNSANLSGGGVINYEAGILTMLGASISHNSAAWGGGVLNWGTFVMHEGQITSNRANYLGGGVWSNSDEAIFRRIGGQIYNNVPDNTNLD